MSEPWGGPRPLNQTPGPPPHGGQPVLEAGRPLGKADRAMILLHGRGATAQGILGLAAELGRPDFTYLAPQAAGHTWYPYRFLAPLDANEPDLSSALAVLAGLAERLENHGVPPERTLLLGFSQGACLTVEFAARHARRWGGVVGLTGGLLGPPERRWEFPGSLAGTPVYLGTSDPDPHVPLERVQETAGVLRGLGGEVELEVFPGLGHTVSARELQAVRRRMARLDEAPGNGGDSAA